MFALVMIQILGSVSNYTVDNQFLGTYNTINECFIMREQVVSEMNYLKGNPNSEFPPVNTQVVCIRVEDDAT